MHNIYYIYIYIIYIYIYIHIYYIYICYTCGSHTVVAKTSDPGVIYHIIIHHLGVVAARGERDRRVEHPPAPRALVVVRVEAVRVAVDDDAAAAASAATSAAAAADLQRAERRDAELLGRALAGSRATRRLAAQRRVRL